MAHPHKADSHVSTPIKRIRWATQRATGHTGRRKRDKIIERFHMRSASNAKKRESSGTESADGSSPAHDGAEPSEADGDHHRVIYFNVPLPDEAKDVDGHPRAKFHKNKIRTAKYTPVSFIPKNLWFQFQNIANVYFLFIIILSVSS